MARSRELDLDELALISGGSDKLFSSINLGTSPSHSYGLISNTFGNNMSFDQANTLLQQFNAPTREALYGQGNDPNATFGVISRPGAQDLPSPLDWGGNVTLQHGDGFAVNTTIDGQHPLEGTISRNLVVDFNDGGGYQVMTLGQGHDGASLATAAGTTIGDGIGGPLGGLIGGSAAQNASHLVNPELGNIAFSELDNAMLAAANGTHNPNLDLPSGRGVEAANAASAFAEGLHTALGDSTTAHGSTAQQETLYDLAHDLNDQGPVTGYFALSANGVGVYHVTADGSKYYELDNGHVVEKPVDEFSGVDAAVAHQAALDAQHPQNTLDGDIHLPDPPPQITGLPPELTPHDGNGQPGSTDSTDHPDSHPDDHGAVTPADASHAADGATTDNSTGHAAADGATHGDASAAPAPAAGSDSTGHTDDGSSHTDTSGASHTDDSASHSADTTASPVDSVAPTPIQVDAPPAPIDIPAPVFDPPPPVSIPDTSASTGAYSNTNPVPVVEPIDPGVDTSSGVGEGSGFDPGGVDAGGFDAGGFDAGGFSGGDD